MRIRFHHFLTLLLLTALAAAGALYRTSTVLPVTGKTELLRTQSRPAHPAQLADAAPLVTPAQHVPRGFFPPGELPDLQQVPALAYTEPGAPAVRQHTAAGKRYLDHNYPYHAFW